MTSLAEGIQKGVVNLNIWMTVIRKMEDAIVECKKGSGRPNTMSWDEAVAFYTGSKEGTDGTATGKLLHELADNRCANFDTCGADAHQASGHSKVNHEIFQQFKFGQRSLLAGDCDQVRLSKELIESRMYIPMIQSTLRYAHIQSNPDTANPKAAAEVATFAAAVLPIVHSCNPQAAEVIYENTNLQASSTSFSHVKTAFEEVYNCMGITCEDVGGYYDSAAGEYFEGAAPCTSTTSSSRWWCKCYWCCFWCHHCSSGRSCRCFVCGPSASNGRNKAAQEEPRFCYTRGALHVISFSVTHNVIKCAIKRSMHCVCVF